MAKVELKQPVVQAIADDVKDAADDATDNNNSSTTKK